MGQTSTAILRSLHISINFGCLIIENLQEPGKSDHRTKLHKRARERAGGEVSPVSNPLSSQQNSIIQIIIRSGSIPKRLSSMEYEGYIKAQLPLTVLEAEERNEIIDDRFRGILRTDQVETYKRKKPGFLRGASAKITIRTSDQIGELLLES